MWNMFGSFYARPANGAGATFGFCDQRNGRIRYEWVFANGDYRVRVV